MSVYNYLNLRGEIVKRYETLGKFAVEVLNITPTQFSNLLNNRQNFSYEQIQKMIDALHIRSEDVGKYFFNRKVA